MSTQDDLRVGICAIAKNEGAYLEEWIAYHHLMGFGPIRVYAHESTDNSHAVLTRLAKAGLCEWVPWITPPNRKPQWLAYQDGLEQLRARSDWLTFIDLDELLVTPRHASIQAFLAEYGHLGAIAVNWKMFGSGGHQRHERGLMMERFTRCAPKEFRSNRAVKTLARTEAIEIPRVHTCHFAPGVVYQTVRGEAIGDQVGSSEDIDHDAIRVNHYFTRSLEEWQAKATRGRGAKRPNSPIKHRTLEEFERNDRNEEQDAAVLRWAEPVKRLIAEINATDIDSVYAELDAADRRARRLETDTERLRDALELATAQSASLHAALLAAERRLETAGAAVARARASASWRLGTRLVHGARLLALRRAQGESALDLAERQLGVAPAADPVAEASPTSVRSLSSQTSASGR